MGQIIGEEGLTTSSSPFLLAQIEEPWQPHSVKKDSNCFSQASQRTFSSDLQVILEANIILLDIHGSELEYPASSRTPEGLSLQWKMFERYLGKLGGLVKQQTLACLVKCLGRETQE